MISFGNLWGLLALAAVPAIVAIHLYRRRFPRLAVAGAFLWGEQTEVRDAGRTRDRLPLTATLLLEILAATLLALILAQPRIGAAGRVPHLVVVLDDSASMGASRGDGKSVRDAAVAEVERRVSELGRRTVVTARGFCFAFWPPPFLRAASIVARGATRARSMPDVSPPLMPAPRWCSRGPSARGRPGAAPGRRTPG